MSRVALIRSVAVLIAVFTAVVSIAGCVPTWTLARIADARVALEEAERYKADKFAPYEYYKAKEYMEQARYKEAYAEFETAARWAKLAAVYARKAKKIAINKQQLPAGLDEAESPYKRLAPPQKGGR